MSKTREKAYNVTDGERLFFRLSKSGRGAYITNREADFGLRGNLDHIKDVIRRKREYATLEVRTKQAYHNDTGKEEAEEIEEYW